VHLLFEARIHTHDLGGRGYAVCDPSAPVRYADLERFLSVLAHPATPIQWQHVAPVPFMLLSYPVEWYIALQRDYLPFLPKPSRNLESLQPAVFNYANLHVIYDDSRARDELDYRSGHTTLEGLYLVVKEWNENVDARLAAGKNSSA
jgi:hypothetical protein